MMKYFLAFMLIIPFMLSAQTDGSWEKLTVPMHSDTAHMVQAANEQGTLFVISDCKILYSYTEESGWVRRLQVGIRLNSFMVSQTIKHIYTEAEHVWVQLYRFRLLGRGFYSDIYRVDTKDRKHVAALDIDSVFYGAQRISGSFYDYEKERLVLAVKCLGLMIKEGINFSTRLTYNSQLMDNCINAMAGDAKGNLWLASETAGLLHYTIDDDLCISYNRDNSLLETNSISDVKVSPTGRLAFSDETSYLYLLEDNTMYDAADFFDEYDALPVSLYVFDSKDNLWIYHNPDSVYRLDVLTNSKQVKYLSKEIPFDLNSVYVRSIVPLRQSVVFFTSQGLYSYKYGK